MLFLLCQSPKLTLLSTLPVLPLIAYCFYSGRIIKGYTEQCQSSKKQMNGLAELMLELFPVIQMYDASRLLHNAMDERIWEWRDNNIRREKVSARLMSLSGLLSFLPLLLLGFGGNMVIEGEIGIGTFYIFINLSGHVSGFLQNMPNQYAGFRRFEASVGSLGDKLVMGE
ncbi:MAG: ABC transporter transmembrane domain-containing protein [bacterium]|nr:ABC transporter transmembrane domain-containing protein [bacterium]MCM1373780.1 ABC transporter transmembrane domain-containing protein [Muribaculum sp.]